VREFGSGLSPSSHGYGLPPNQPFIFPYYAKAQELEGAGHRLHGSYPGLMPTNRAGPMHWIPWRSTSPIWRSSAPIRLALTEEAIALAWKHPNVFLGTSAHAPKYWKPELAKFIDSRARTNAVGNRLPPHRPQGIAEPDRSRWALGRARKRSFSMRTRPTVGF